MKKISALCVKSLLAWLVLGSPSFVWAQSDNVVSHVTGEQFSTLKKIVDWIVESMIKYSFQVFGGIVILIIGWVIARFVCRFVHDFLKQKRIDVTVSKFIVSAVRLFVMLLAAVIALGKFGIEIAPLIAGLSVAGFGISFALQGVLSNYVAGATLIFTKPFKVGDIIEVVDRMGEVEDMTLPRTLIRTVDGTLIVIPNKHIIGEIIHNYSDLKRLDIKVGISYKSDVDRAVKLLRDVINQEKRIVQKNEPKIGILEFAESSVNLEARLWCKQSDYWDAMFGVNKGIFENFKKNNIDIPFPQRDVHLYRDG